MAKSKTDQEIIRAAAEEHRRKADEAFRTYQETGITRYETLYRKHDAISDALFAGADVKKAKGEASYYRAKLSELAGKYGAMKFMPDDIRLNAMDDLMKDLNFWAKMEGLIS